MKLQQALAIHEHALDCVNEETLRACARVLGDALLQKQKAFDELCQLWTPVYNYARNHPDITLGESIAGFTLELMRKADALREQKPVVQYMARRLTPEATKEMWGYVLVDGLQPGAMLYAAPVAAPTVPTDEQIHAAYRVALGQSIRERDMPEIRKFAIALLQSLQAQGEKQC